MRSLGFDPKLAEDARSSHMIIGADFYETDEQKAAIVEAGGVPVGIGEGCTITNAIIDKNARIGKNCIISNAAGVEK